jgi:outer membrane protein insertion porin family
VGGSALPSVCKPVEPGANKESAAVRASSRRDGPAEKGFRGFMSVTDIWMARGLRRALAVVGLLFAFAAAGGPAFAQQVRVIGNQRIEADTIRSYLNLRPGQPFTAERQDEALRALVNTGLFRDVRITREGGAIVVRVVENAVVNRVTFEGNRRVDTPTLRREVETQTGGVFTPGRLTTDVSRMQELYRRQGRQNVAITPRTVELPQGRVDVVYEIREGERTSIASISFVGNRAFGDGRLRDVITTKTSNWLSWLSTRDVYDPDRLNVDQELLRRFYLRNGYADFRVVSAVADFNADRNAFSIVITVDEGEQYRFGAIDIESNVGSVEAASLRSYVRTSSGSTYNAELIDRTLEDMSVEINRRGYAFAQVRPRGDRDPVARVVNVTYVVDEAPRIYVERINVRGNTRTMDRVIRREFEVAEGDALNRVLVDRAERRLNGLGYFNTVRITREPGSTPDRVVLNVNVEEKSTGEVSFGVGYASNEGIIADVSISERNFLGRGQFVRAAVGWGERRRSLDFSFTEPYFLDRRLAAGFDIFYRRTSASSTQSFTQEVRGAGVRLGVLLTDDLSTQVRYRGYQQRIRFSSDLADCGFGAVPPVTVVGGVNDTGPPTPTNPRGIPNSVAGNGISDCLDNGEASLALRLAEGTALVNMVGTSLVLNRLDNARTPRNGIYADVNLDFGHVSPDFGPNGTFARVTSEFRGYYNFLDDMVAMVRIQGGHIQELSGELRVVDSFFKGPDLVRGFRSGGIGARDVTTARLDSLGGTTYFGASAELQFPVPFIPEELGLRGAFFADAGTLFGIANLDRATAQGFTRCTASNVPAGCNYFQDDGISIRSSVGVSLLWQSPLGPLRFDFARALTREDYDRTQAFRFSGGTTF